MAESGLFVVSFLAFHHVLGRLLAEKLFGVNRLHTQSFGKLGLETLDGVLVVRHHCLKGAQTVPLELGKRQNIGIRR